jgi:hypothetical protein
MRGLEIGFGLPITRRGPADFQIGFVRYFPYFGSISTQLSADPQRGHDKTINIERMFTAIYRNNVF